MKYCNNCQISYKNNLDKCLICHDTLTKLDDKKTLEYNYTPYKKKGLFQKYFFKSFVLFNIISLVTIIYIDYYNGGSLSYSLIVALANLYLIVFIKTILNNWSLTLKGLAITFITVIYIIGLGVILKDYHWAIDIVLPFTFVANTLMLTITTFIKRVNWQKYAVFLILSIFTNIGLILLNLFKITVTTWPTTLSFLYGLLTLFGLLIFTPKEVKEEINRRLHL